MSRSLNIRVPLPAPSGVLGANLLGVAGLLTICVAIGGLLGVWAGLLAAGVAAVALAYVASTHVADPEPAPAARPAPLRNVS